MSTAREPRIEIRYEDWSGGSVVVRETRADRHVELALSVRQLSGARAKAVMAAAPPRADVAWKGEEHRVIALLETVLERDGLTPPLAAGMVCAVMLPIIAESFAHFDALPPREPARATSGWKPYRGRR